MKTDSIIGLVNWHSADSSFFKGLQDSGIDVAVFVCHNDRTRHLCKQLNPRCLTIDLMKDFIHHHKNSAYLHHLLQCKASPWNAHSNRELDPIFWVSTLEMMTRHYGTYGWSSVQDKIFYVYKCLSFWFYYLSHHKVTTLIFNNTPHEVDDYIIYHVAKVLKINTYIIQPILAQPLCIVRNSPSCPPLELSELNKKLEENYLKKSDISRFASEYLSLISNEIAYLPEEQVRYKTRLHNNWRKLQQENPRFHTHTKKLYEYYQSNSVCVTPNQPFVYFPLHFQPEETTSPSGGLFTEQRLAIQTIAQSLPDDWLLLVKEHPMQFSPPDPRTYPYRNIEYYKDIQRLPNTALINMNISSQLLIDKSSAVSTITGTAGFEAFLKSKPVMVFGKPWYSALQGVTCVDCYEDCILFFKKINLDQGESYEKNKSKIESFFDLFTTLTFSEESGKSENFYDAYGKIKISHSFVETLVNSISFLGMSQMRNSDTEQRIVEF